MFYTDKPIQCGEDDQLGRVGFVHILAETLLNMRTEDTCSVGLYGKWGSGKTSVVNMALHEIEERQRDLPDSEKLIIIRFEPWNFSDTNQLITQFFIRLSNEFRKSTDKKFSKIGNALEEYADAFDAAEAIPVVGGLFAFLGKTGATSLAKKLKKGSDEKDISKQKENVISLLKEQQSRILVILDDIDRLSNEQIRQVFQLIASVAKFPNTIYLLVFDKDIVVEALKEVQKGDGEDYLEKIIQMPIQIPNVQKSKVRKVLTDRLNGILSNQKNASTRPAHWQRVFETCIHPFVENLRDINRLCNSVQFKLTGIPSEVDFSDMVAISAIEMRIPPLYEWIKDNKSILTGKDDYSFLNHNNKSQQEWLEFYRCEIQDLMQNTESTCAETKNVDLALNFLSCLFPHFGEKVGKLYGEHDYAAFRRFNQIAHPGRFDRYFKLDLESTDFKNSDILEATYEMDVEQLCDFLMKQDKNGISYEFLEELRAMIPDISPDRAKTIIASLVNVSERISSSSKTNMLSPQASSLAEHMVIELLDRVENNERFLFFLDLLRKSGEHSLPSLANIINMFELSYGRLAAKGEERHYLKVFSLEQLFEIEGAFTQRAKSLLENCNLFDLCNWRIVCYLLECFDSNYINSYLSEAFHDSGNVVRYLSGSVTQWIGSRIEYEVHNDYQKNLSDERIMEAIENQRKTGKLFLQPEEVQNACAAFILLKTGKTNDLEHVEQASVDLLLDSWR